MHLRVTFLMLAVAWFAGCIGGIGALSWHVIKKRQVRLAQAVAFMLFGGVLSVVTGMFILLYSKATELEVVLGQVLLVGVSVGLIGGIVIIGFHWVSEIWFKWQGLQLKITLHERGVDKKERGSE